MYDAHNFEQVLDPDVCIYDAANFVTDQRTDKPILGVGFLTFPKYSKHIVIGRTCCREVRLASTSTGTRASPTTTTGACSSWPASIFATIQAGVGAVRQKI